MPNQPLLLTSVFGRPSGFLARLQQNGTLGGLSDEVPFQQHSRARPPSEPARLPDPGVV